MSYSVSHNPNLYQWKRFTKPKTKGKKDSVISKEDDIQNWLERVEAATDAAVRSTFHESHGARPSRSRHPRDDDILQAVGRIHDDQDAYAEAQELVSDWVNEKIRYNFLETEDTESLSSGIPEVRRQGQFLTSGIETAAHEKWYEDSEMFIQQYLDSSDRKTGSNKRHNRHETHENDVLGQLDIYEADENSVVEALMKNMMEKPLIKPSEIRTLKNRSSFPNNKKTTKFRDPKTTMDMRHKEVKEARLRRQKVEDKRKQERMFQKEAKFKAQQILKEEETQKKLREKQEEEAIQAEMAKLRKEMVEQRKRDEKERKEREREFEKVTVQASVEMMTKREEMEEAEREKEKEKLLSQIFQLEEKERKVADVMRKRNTENRKLVRIYFSNWCKIVLNRRVKMGKSKAMADWKCMQRTWVAWKSYTRNQKLDIETRYHQANVREARIKDKKATECARSRLLRKCFLTWKVWVRTEQEGREILKQQENTKAKMQALLDAVSSGNIGKKTEDDLTVLQSLDSECAIADLPHFEPQKPKNIKRSREKEQQPTSKRNVTMPKEVWQVTKKHVKHLRPEDFRLNPSTSQSKTVQHMTPTRAYDPFENRHNFQKELIDQQRMLLQEQKRMIQGMQEQQRLQTLQEEIAVLQKQQKVLENDKNGMNIAKKHPISEVKNDPRNLDEPQQILSAPSEVSWKVSTVKKHPIVSKMEERAAERAKRKKEFEELKRKKEQEKIRRMQEEEEQKQREDNEKKMMEVQARREAKRLQKKMEDEKRAALERMKELSRMADNHYTTTLMKNHGFKPWRNLLEAVERKQEVAAFHYNGNLLSRALVEWRAETERITKEREEKADSLYGYLLLRRGMRSWKKYGERMDILEQKATIHRNQVLKKRYLKYWVDYVTDEKMALWDKEARADKHNRLRQLLRVFNVIRSYRELVKCEAERHRRLGEMRRKVTQLLPDFQYTKESFTSNIFEEEVNGDGGQDVP